jgi:hypothetical protein
MPHFFTPVADIAYNTLRTGRQTVATAGTRIQLKTVDVFVRYVVIAGLSANSGLIYVGDSGVSSSNGYELFAGGSIAIPIDNLNKVYIDSSVNGDGVCFYYLENQ